MAKFASLKYPALRLIIRPTRRRVIDGEIIRESGITLKFKDHLLTVEDEAIIKQIRESRRFGVDYFEYSDKEIAEAAQAPRKRGKK